jgi:ureidoglycolate lyase
MSTPMSSSLTKQIELTAKPLTQALFAPFGEIIEANEQGEHFSINYGLTERYHALASIDSEQQNGKGIISIFRSTPKPLPLYLDCMERHPLGSQAFYPLSGRPYLVVVAARGQFDQDKLHAFIARPDQGINYYKGTWHHYCLALEQSSDFLVIDRQGEGNNCDEVALTKPILINF